VSLEALAEKGCSDSGRLDSDSGGELMTNKNKSLASESDGNVCLWVPYLCWVTHEGGSGESFIGSKTKLFEKVFSKEFRNLKLFLKIPGFQFFFNPSFPRRVYCEMETAG